MRIEEPESVVKWTMPPQRRCWITWLAAVVVLLLSPSSTNSQESQPKPESTVCKYPCFILLLLLCRSILNVYNVAIISLLIGC